MARVVSLEELDSSVRITAFLVSVVITISIGCNNTNIELERKFLTNIEPILIL